MATKDQEMQFWIAKYKADTGKKEVMMHDVAEYMLARGWPAPKPLSPGEILAKELARAARNEYVKDGATGYSVRKNHALRFKNEDGAQLAFWVEIHEASRPQMWQSMTNRREQMVGDAFQLTIDSEYWNRINPKEEPIQIELDFGFDVELRKNTPPADAA